MPRRKQPPASESGDKSVTFAHLKAEAGDEERLRVADDAYAELARLGLTLPPKPEQFNGVVPEGVYDLTYEELGELMADLAQWAGYVNGQYARILLLTNQAKGIYEFRRRRVKLQLTGAESSKTDQAEQQVEVFDARCEYDYYKCQLEIVKAIQKANEGDKTTVSRIISLREQESFTNRRVDVIKGRRTSPGTRRRDR